MASIAGVWSGMTATRRCASSRKVQARGKFSSTAFGAGGGIELPFGGMKKSGHGREKGFAALHDCSQIRTTITKHG